MLCKVGAGIRKTFLAVAFVLALLLSAVVGACLVYLANANPFVGAIWTGEVSPDAETKPPTIVIISPENNTAYRTDNVALSLNVSVGNSSTANARLIKAIYYEADWQPDNIYVYERIPETNMPVITEFSTTITLTSIPDGYHTITVNATERGDYLDEVDYCNNRYYKVFEITDSSSVSFTVDTTPPKTSVLSPENKTYDTADVQLNFAVNETASQIKYSPDGQENVVVSGNTTLAGLPEGEHSVTVYAQDNAGNIGASATIYFSVKVSLPTVVAAVAVSVAVVCIGLLIYFKKRNHSP